MLRIDDPIPNGSSYEPKNTHKIINMLMIFVDLKMLLDAEEEKVKMLITMKLKKGSNLLSV